MRPLPVGEPWGDYAVSTARWTGALLHEVLEQAKPARGRRRGPLHRAPTTAPTTSSRSSRSTDTADLTFVRVPDRSPTPPIRQPRS